MVQEYPTELCNAIICRFTPEETLQLLNVLLYDELFNSGPFFFVKPFTCLSIFLTFH